MHYFLCRYTEILGCYDYSLITNQNTQFSGEIMCRIRITNWNGHQNSLLLVSSHAYIAFSTKIYFGRKPLFTASYSKKTAYGRLHPNSGHVNHFVAIYSSQIYRVSSIHDRPHKLFDVDLSIFIFYTPCEEVHVI